MGISYEATKSDGQRKGPKSPRAAGAFRQRDSRRWRQGFAPMSTPGMPRAAATVARSDR